MTPTIKTITCGLIVASSFAFAGTAIAAPDLATEMSLQLARYMNATLHSSQGDAEAARLLGESTGKFNTVLDVAVKGGNFHNCTYAPASPSAQSELSKLSQAWGFYQHGNEVIQQNLQTTQNFVAAIKTINQNQDKLLELSTQASTKIVLKGGSATNLSASAWISFLTVRLNSSANSMLFEPAMSPQTAFLLGKDTLQIKDIVQALLNGSATLRTTPVKPDARANLKDYEQLFTNDAEASQSILNNLQGEIAVKQAIAELDRRSEPLHLQIQALADSLPQGQDCH